MTLSGDEDFVYVNGEPVATDADVEELEEKLEKAERKAKRRTIAGLLFSALTFVVGLLI
ncbi:hypothetical protein HWV07_15560 [Natronomonas salina]|uniref:hypothetical protein n=1 Tax=Natronomonas salina TaxID=1710540 RepID=UPI0015B60E66|nr:hypothetical protein [Natronomonas salina]QLD90376.1 hypothetical protein HWV07_15560 [Natronomonas salina]